MINDNFVGCSKCRVPLVIDFSRPGMEWRCPKCGEFTQFFDDHINQKWEKYTEEQQKFYTDAMAKKEST